MKIHVKSLPARSVLTDIAAALGDTGDPGIREDKIADDCSEFFLKIPPSMGKGDIRAVTFPTGFSLYQYDCCFNQDVRINFNITRVQPLKFVFCNAGHIDHCFADGTVKMHLSQYQNIIVAGDSDHGHNIYFEAGKRVQLTSMEIDRPISKSFTPMAMTALTPSCCSCSTIPPRTGNSIFGAIIA